MNVKGIRYDLGMNRQTDRWERERDKQTYGEMEVYEDGSVRMQINSQLSN